MGRKPLRPSISCPKDAEHLIIDTQKTPSSRRYETIEIIRGIAALAVFLTHYTAEIIEWVDDGWGRSIKVAIQLCQVLFGGGGIHFAVIMFLVVSGFCIHFPQVLNKKSRGNAFWFKYICRRAIRILPVYWFGLLLGYIHLIIEWNYSTNSWPIMESTLSPQIFLNLIGFSEIARFIVTENFYPGNGPLSTVAVEILIYLIYPFLYIAYRKHGLKIMLLTALVSYTVIVGLRIADFEPTFLHGTLFELLTYWIIGACLAEVFVGSNRLLVMHRYNLTLFGVVLFVSYLLITNLLHIRGLHIFYTLFFAVCVAIFIVVFLAYEESCDARPLRSWFLGAISYIGRRSYSLYVIHTPVIYISIYVLDMHTRLMLSAYPIVVLVCVMLVTEITFRCLEQPLIRFSKRFC
jgi:peptidoglycan/LPS O-acetylase OafA/YrhL